MTDLPPIEYGLTPQEQSLAAWMAAYLERQRREANRRERDALERALGRALEAVCD